MVTLPAQRGIPASRRVTGLPGPGAGAPSVILVMGVSASGKSTVARALSSALDGTFIEGDDYHSSPEVERMRRGTPLDDEARRPWLRRVRAAIDKAIAGAADGHPVVVACSALKASYRSILLDGIDRAAIVLLDVDPATLDSRLRHRPGHFMPPGLLESQLADLEPPAEAIRVDASRGPDAAVATVRGAIGVPEDSRAEQGHGPPRRHARRAS
jgi:gluconokinase